MFQPQNIVANPDILFYKANATEHREKLRTIFPYVLGALTPELLAKRWEMDQVQRDLRRLDRELSAQSQATEHWKAELKVWISEARQLGLVSEDEVIEEHNELELINILRKVVAKSSRDASVTVAVIENSSREASELDREEATIALHLSEVRTRMEKMIQLRHTVDEYTGSLIKQRERLGLSRWLRELQHDSFCPICGGQFKDAEHELGLLCDALAAVEASARQMSPAPAAFDRELVQVRQEVRRFTDQLHAIRLRRQRLEERSKRESKDAWRRSAVDRFLGRAEQALSMLASPTIDDNVLTNIEKLHSRLEELRGELSEADIRRRIRAALFRVSGAMSRVLPTLDTERPYDSVELDIKNLTIRVTGESGRADYLWEIGSGANWLSYHVAATLALQELFIKQAASPVPSLLVYDQPSQVYFPQTLAREAEFGNELQLRDEDVTAVRKVFEAFGRSVILSSGSLQVIVLDHAGYDVWGNVPGIHVVEEWRDGRALIPELWLI